MAVVAAADETVDVVSLLSSESESEGDPWEEEDGVIEVIDLLDSDDPDVIELLGSSDEEDDEDEDDVQIVGITAAGSGSAPVQPQWQPRQAIYIYVDGSYKSRAQKSFKMTGGIWAAGGALKLSRILQGGKADSVRAELGTIFAALEYIQAGGLQNLLGSRISQAAAAAAAAATAISAATSAAASPTAAMAAAAATFQPPPPPAAAAAAAAAVPEVHLLTDCEACLKMLGCGKVKKKYTVLVQRIKQLRSELPFKVRVFKVKGHSKANDAHAVGNKAADRLARSCGKHQPVVLLPA